MDQLKLTNLFQYTYITVMGASALICITGHCIPNFECDTCDRYFNSQTAVNQHMTDVGHWDESSESDQTVYECDDCDDAFYEENELRDHEAYKTPGRTMIFITMGKKYATGQIVWKLPGWMGFLSKREEIIYQYSIRL